MHSLPRSLAVAGITAALTLVAAAQKPAHPNGIFSGETDIGQVQPGSTAWNSSTDTYKITGGGADMWGSEDDFHYDWVRFTGDGSLTADVVFPPGMKPPNEKAVLVFRQSLDPGSAYADVAIHADGHITLQWRDDAGNDTDDKVAPVQRARTIRIERRGDHYTAAALMPNGQMQDFATTIINMHDPVYLGIGVCAHDSAGTAAVTFSNVRIVHSGAARKPPQP